MNQIRLNDGIRMRIETMDNNVRLVLSKNSKELACRKGPLKEIDKFLALDTGNLFKGRLQLSKKDDLVAIHLNNKIVGEVTTIELNKLFDIE